ncbi:Hypothetical protein NRBB11_1424 [Bifidobacterium breve]|nr:Hypothetical protein NRBB11_1424 [Bifidobacterium breve]
MGSDSNRNDHRIHMRNFNPRSPDGERPTRWPTPNSNRYFNPRSPDGERQVPPRASLPVAISIHAPRMGSDPRRPRIPHLGRDFNPRSPDGERRDLAAKVAHVVGISIHAPRMGSDTALPVSFATFWRFQSTLPGWGATYNSDTTKTEYIYFNPRSPDGERLTCATHKTHSLPISIHAPRMGSDCPD